MTSPLAFSPTFLLPPLPPIRVSDCEVPTIGKTVSDDIQLLLPPMPVRKPEDMTDRPWSLSFSPPPILPPLAVNGRLVPSPPAGSPSRPKTGHPLRRIAAARAARRMSPK